MENLRRIRSEDVAKSFDKWTSHFGLKLKYPKAKSTNQRLAGREHEPWQPRLATEADVETDKKTRKRTKGAVATDRAKHNGNSSSVRRVDYGPTKLTNFGKIAEHPLAPKKCIVDALVDKGTVAPKPCFSPGEMRTLTAVDGLLPAGTASTALRHIFFRPLPS